MTADAVICPKCGLRFVPAANDHAGHGAGHAAGHGAHAGGLGFLASAALQLTAALVARVLIKHCPACGDEFFVSAAPCEINSFVVGTSDGSQRVGASVSMLLRGAKDSMIGIVVGFSFSDGTPLRDRNNSFRKPDGQVAILERRQISSNLQTLVLADLSLPYEELHLAAGQDYPLLAILTVHLVDGKTWSAPLGTSSTLFRWNAP